MHQRWVRELALACALAILAVSIYSLPSLCVRKQLGSSELPPIFAPDLTLYLNVGNFTSISKSEGMNPYYRVPVPKNGAGYLKFDLAARSFATFNTILGNRTSFAMPFWNGFWWACLCISATYLFRRFLPPDSGPVGIVGVLLLMFFNFGVAGTILQAWEHLPSLAGFNGIGLPFMRAFVPVIPGALLLIYLSLQMEALRRQGFTLWLVMAAVQLLALAVFPYATLFMAGITAVSMVAEIVAPGNLQGWRVPIFYASLCALLDFGFLLHGSIGFYESGSPAIHFQPMILPQLVGLNWAVLVVLTIATALVNRLPSRVKWPLVGLGATNALLMLGDAIVPASKILLSHHAAHFLHTTVAVLATFLAGTAWGRLRTASPRFAYSLAAMVALLIVANGLLLAWGNFRGSLTMNRDVIAFAELPKFWSPIQGDLIIARSQDVDDACGWMALVSTTPVLYCTDSEVMLTAQQNHDVQRFRQALYLYLTGQNSKALEQAISAPDSMALMYRLGYWAEAASNSAEERMQGVYAIKNDLIPQFQRVERHDDSVNKFFRGYKRIIVIEKTNTFDPGRLATFLKLETQTRAGNFVLSLYQPIQQGGVNLGGGS